MFQVHQLRLVSPSPSIAFLVHWQDLNICLFLVSLIFTIGHLRQQSPLFGRFSSFFLFFFVNYHLVWSSSQDLGICLYLKNPREFCVFHFPGWVLVCAYTIWQYGQISDLHNSQLITFPTQSCLVLYSFCASLLHLLIMWLIISSLLSHNLNILSCCILFILTLIYLVHMALF